MAADRGLELLSSMSENDLRRDAAYRSLDADLITMEGWPLIEQPNSQTSNSQLLPNINFDFDDLSSPTMQQTYLQPVDIQRERVESRFTDLTLELQRIQSDFQTLKASCQKTKQDVQKQMLAIKRIVEDMHREWTREMTRVRSDHRKLKIWTSTMHDAVAKLAESHNEEERPT